MLLIASDPQAPEHIVSEWKLWDGGRLWLAPRVRCVAVEATEEGGEGEGGGAVGSAGDEPAHLPEDEELFEDSEEEEVAAEDERMGAPEWDAALAGAASHVHLSALDALDIPAALGVSAALRMGGFLGTYVKCDVRAVQHLREFAAVDGEPKVNGRFVYVHIASHGRVMMWWANGFWHVGSVHHLGQQLGALIAQSNAYVPEDVEPAWQMSVEHRTADGHVRRRWEDVPGLHCDAGPAPPNGGAAERAARPRTLMVAIGIAACLFLPRLLQFAEQWHLSQFWHVGESAVSSREWSADEL